MAGEFRIGDRTIEKGKHAVVRLPVTVDLDGNEIAVTVHAIVGQEPGPTLALLSTLHGSEWLSVEVIRRIVNQVKPEDLRGVVLALPVGNPVAFGRLTRNTPDESDNADLNRVFPGGQTWIAEQLAKTIADEILARADALVDFHMGFWGATLVQTVHGTDYPNAEVVASCGAMAKAFGWPCIRAGFQMSVFPGPRSSTGFFGGVLGRPCIGVSIGGSGFDRALEDSWLDANVTGTLNVMKHLAMMDGDAIGADRYLVFRKSRRVNPSKGGYLVPEVMPERLLTEVEQGELLGRVISPYTFEEIERLEAPIRGILFYTARSYPVRPGDWAFGIVDLSDPYTRWE